MEHAKTIQNLIDKNLINLTSERVFLAAFGYAFKRGSVELAERMLLYDRYTKMDQVYPEAMYYAAKNNWPTIVSKLSEKGLDINALTDGETPLYAACKAEHEIVVRLLLDSDSDPNVKNKPTTSEEFLVPLQVAVQRGNAVICNMLLQKGAKLDEHREPLLHVVCSTGSNEQKTGNTLEATSVEQTLSVVRLLLQLGVNVNTISDQGDTALYRVCASQQLEVVQVLLEAGADVNLTSSRRFPLIAACSTINIELINLLVRSGADVNCSNTNNETCLHVVINAYFSNTDLQDTVKLNDTLNIIKSLLEVGANVNARTSQEETALYRASKAGHQDIVRSLLEVDAETNGSRSRRPLFAACEGGYTSIVDLLLQNGADPNASSTASRGTYVVRPAMTLSGLKLIATKDEARSSSLPICCAVQKGHTDVVKLLLKHDADVNKADQSGKSALIYAVEFLTSRMCRTSQVLNASSDERDFSFAGMIDLMKELINHGADCNQLTASGKSALDFACEKGHEAAVEILLQNGAKPDVKTPVLCTAVKNGSETMVKMLLKHRANVNAHGEKGNTALHLATSNTTVLETLLNAGADVNATNDSGETALSLVCKKRQANANVVELLLKFGADANMCFPLHAACKNNATDVVKLLLEYGADSNRAKRSDSELSRRLAGWQSTFARYIYLKDSEPSALCIACRNGNLAIVDCLLKNGAATAFVDSDGNSALHFAVDRHDQQAGSEEYDPIVTLLLQHDAPVNVVSNAGETPLYVACKKGLIGVVKQLIDCRADVGLTTSDSNKYPLIIACEINSRDIAMMLLERGADSNVSSDGETPLKLASANGDDVLVKQLISHRAKVNQMQNVSDTALHVAMVRCKCPKNEASINIVKRLLKNRAQPNAFNEKGQTPLYLACVSTIGEVNLEIVQILLEHGGDPNICPPLSSTRPMMPAPILYQLYADYADYVLPPLSAVSNCGNAELAGLLMRFGANVGHKTERGRTALHYAICGDGRFIRHIDFSKSNPVTTAEMLLSAGADANAMDKTGASPLYLACESGKTELVKLLLKRGANPTMEATVSGRLKNPMHAACRHQDCDSVKLLLEHNANVLLHDEDGKTALHCALESDTYLSSDSDKRIVIVQLLLDRGAEVNAVSDDGQTPFYIACSKV